jgi:hypothetical protein
VKHTQLSLEKQRQTREWVAKGHGKHRGPRSWVKARRAQQRAEDALMRDAYDHVAYEHSYTPDIHRLFVSLGLEHWVLERD